MASNSTIVKFNPEDHRDNLYDSFCEFVDSFQYEYDAIAKDPPDGDNATQAAWVEQNKRKIFLGRFASRNLQKDYEDAVSVANRSTITFTQMVTSLKDRYKPTRNHTLANYEFHKINQKHSESFDSFVSRVKHEAKNCEFSCEHEQCKVPDILIRDQIIIGTTNDEIRKNALKNQWNLVDLVYHGRQLEAATHGAERIAADKNEHNDNLKQYISRVKTPGRYSKKNKHFKDQNDTNKQREPKSKCQTCSSKTCLGKKACPAYHCECFDCHKKGHFRGAIICKYSPKKRYTRRVESETDSSDTIETDSDSSCDSSNIRNKQPVNDLRRNVRLSKHVTKIKRIEHSFIRNISTKPRYQVDIIIKENIVSAFADTGADINVMSLQCAKSIQLPLTKSKTKIRPYGSKPLKCIGHYDGTVMYGGTVANIRLYVVKPNVETLLSGKVCEELGIIAFKPQPSSTAPSSAPKVRNVNSSTYKDSLINDYQTVFNGIGKLETYTAEFYIDSSVPPIAFPARPIPFHLQDRFNNEISKMEAAGIIEQHTGPAPWISNPVLAPKDDGGIRVTVDMREANKAILSTNIPIPRAEDIRAKLAGCNYFSKLDFKAAFHQIEIAEHSRYITVFHAGDRLMRYRRLTMGSKPASGELTKALLPLFAKFPQVHVIHDDVIIGTETLSQHQVLIPSILQTIQQAGLTLNQEKCIFAKQSIPFWGLIISKDGVQPDPSKVEALHYAGIPDSKDEVMSFLCMIQSLSDFIPNLAQKTYHLRQLTKKHKQFHWKKCHQEEFDNLKTALQKSTLLKHFQPHQATYIYVDAHHTGLSAILLQGCSLEEAKPVAFASRATTDVESRYPQLDLEALAIDFGLRRYRQYIVGGPTVEVITDHKPLVAIFSNTRKGSIRTDRIKLRHQDVSFNVLWREGIKNPSDYLSRHAIPFKELPKEIRKESSEFEKIVWFLQFSPFTESISMAKIITETEADKLLTTLKSHIQQGFIPKSSTHLKPFQLIFDELTISDEGLIMRGDKIVLPESLWNIAFKKAHQGGHPGINSLKRRIRSHFWFPELNKYIENAVKKCNLCQMFSTKTTKEPVTPVYTSAQPWKDVSIDLFGPMPDSKHILVVQDMFTRFPAAEIVNSTKAEPVLKSLDNIYSNFGTPESHRTDNGPPFNSQKFTDFSNRKGIIHNKVYPYHPQANPVETFMKPLGKAMKIADYQHSNKETVLNEMLASYRATPHPATNQAPGNLMFQHGYHHHFPISNNTPHSDKTIQAHTHHLAQQAKRRDNLNLSTHRKATAIHPGQIVITKNHKRNKFHPYYGPEQYQVLAKHSNNGVVLQSTNDNCIIQRHLDDIKPIRKEDEPTNLTIPTTYIWEPFPKPVVFNQFTNSNEYHTPELPNSNPVATQHQTDTNLLPPQTMPVSIPSHSLITAPTYSTPTIVDTVKQNKRNRQPIQRYTDTSALMKKGK